MLGARFLACTRSQLAPLATRHSMARLPPLAAHRARMLSDATSKAAGDAAPSAEAAAAEAAEPTKEASEAGAAEEEAAEVDPIVALEARVAELDKELADKHDQVLRAMAEADNARRRAALDVEKSHKFGVSKFAKDLLEVADNLSRAADSVPEEMRSSDEHPVLKALYEGVTMTDGQLLKTFGKHGASYSSTSLHPSTPFHPLSHSCSPTCLVRRPHEGGSAWREVRPQLPCAARLRTILTPHSTHSTHCNFHRLLLASESPAWTFGLSLSLSLSRSLVSTRCDYLTISLSHYVRTRSSRRLTRPRSRAQSCMWPPRATSCTSDACAPRPSVSSRRPEWPLDTARAGEAQWRQGPLGPRPVAVEARSGPHLERGFMLARDERWCRERVRVAWRVERCTVGLEGSWGCGRETVERRLGQG